MITRKNWIEWAGTSIELDYKSVVMAPYMGRVLMYLGLMDAHEAQVLSWSWWFTDKPL